MLCGKTRPDLSGQGHPYSCKSLNDYFCLLCCTHICDYIPMDYLVCWYDCCLIQSGLVQSLTRQSVASAQLFPLLVQWSQWPLPLPGPRSPHFHSLPFGQLPWAGNMICQGTVEVLDKVADMLLHPMEEAIPEMLLGLQIHNSHRALEPNLVKGPFQPHGKGRNLFTTPLVYFINFCMRTSNKTTMPKMTDSLLSIFQC